MNTLYVNDICEICLLCANCRKTKSVKISLGKKIAKYVCSCGTATKFKIEWRKGPRKPYEVAGYVGSFRLKTIDLSLRGISFESKLNVLRGAKVEISFPLEFIKGRTTDLAVVVEITSRKEKIYGAKFLNLQEGSQAKKDIYSWLMEK